MIDQWIGDELLAWGTGTSGQLGNALILNRSTPVTTRVGGSNWKQISAGSVHTAAIKTDGTLWMWGLNGLHDIRSSISKISKNPNIIIFATGFSQETLQLPERIESINQLK